MSPGATVLNRGARLDAREAPVTRKGGPGLLRRAMRYSGQVVVRPPRGIDAVASDPQGLWTGLWMGVLFLAAYALTVLIYYLLGHQPMAEPFLTIPLDRWYLVQTFTTIPVGMAGFLAYAGVAYLLARLWGGRGSYDATLGASMYALVLPWIFFTLSFELLVAPFLIARGIDRLPWPDWIEALRVYGLPIPWMFALCTLVIVRVHDLAWWKGLLIASVAVIPMAGIMAVFIR
jgi:hypothetical protein